MTCNCYLSFECYSGICPVSLFDEYGSVYFDCISCDECCYYEGLCDDCILQYSEDCPLEYLLAEAEPVR